VKSRNSSQCNETLLFMTVRPGKKVWFSVCCGKLATTETTGLTLADCSRSMQQSLERCGRQQ